MVDKHRGSGIPRVFPSSFLRRADSKARLGTLLIIAVVCGFFLECATPGGSPDLPELLADSANLVLGCVAAAFYGSPVAIWLQSRLGSLLSLARWLPASR